MQITIVVDDKIVLIDRKPLELPELDWSVFDMDPANPDDDVAAVQFDTVSGMGHVEFKTRITKQVNRPNNRPPDWLIGAADFEKHFGFVIPAYEAKSRIVELEAAAREAERLERLRLAGEAPPESVRQEGLVTKEEAEALATKAAEEAVARFAAEIAKSAEGGDADQ